MKKIQKEIIVAVVSVIVVLLSTYLAVFLKSKKNQIYIELTTNGGVPYNWEYTIENDEIVKFVKSESKEEKKNVTGGRVNLKYYFEGIKEGKTTITFEYKNIVDGTIDDVKVYNVVVDKKLDTEIEENK